MLSVHNLQSDLSLRQRALIKGPFGGLISGGAPLLDRLDSIIGSNAFSLIPGYMHTLPHEGMGTFGLLAGDALLGRLVFVGHRNVEFQVDFNDIALIAPIDGPAGWVEVRAYEGSYIFDVKYRKAVDQLCATLDHAQRLGAF